MDNAANEQKSFGTSITFQGYIPESGLIFYFPFDEIKDLIRYRSGRLVARAVRRRNIIPLQNACQYPEIIHGDPKPVIINFLVIINL